MCMNFYVVFNTHQNVDVLGHPLNILYDLFDFYFPPIYSQMVVTSTGTIKAKQNE